MTHELFENLLAQGESSYVDFKLTHYFPSTGTKDKDAEFVKDIISLTNTPRTTNAYIIIGVKEENNTFLPVGLSGESTVDNSILQAKVRNKVNPVPKFSAYPYIDKLGKRFEIIEIPITWYSAPCTPINTTAGILEKDQIYFRRDSQNDKATYDDIMRISEWLTSIPRNSTPRKVPIKIDGKIYFDEETIRKLFGNEAAEDESLDRLREYYFKNEIYSKINVNLPIRILVGHKGIGKSALFKISISEDIEKGICPIMIKPDDVSDLGIDESHFLSIVKKWRIGLTEIIIKKVFMYFGIKKGLWDPSIFDSDNILDSLYEIVESCLDSGNIPEAKIGVAQNFVKTKIINIYIDDLDRGWIGGRTDIVRISALLNAVRDIVNENRGLQFKISLRSDVYYLVRTSDESTDKIQSSVIWYKWTQNEILIMLVKRVLTFLGKDVNEDDLLSTPQDTIATNLDSIIEPVFYGVGKWSSRAMYRVLLSVIRKRPRDLVKLLTLAARAANDRNGDIILTKDMQKIFNEYSLDRIQDTINEYKSELPQIERLIFGMKPNRKTLKASENYYYTTPNLLLKINQIKERGEFFFADGKKADAKDLAHFLYKINFITATKRLENGFLDRKDFEENRYLVPKFEDFGYDWEVHMAFRWGLQPNSQEDIFSEL